ncbi:hypothetical protein BDN72DRAFT_847188 [Pluteus cervinus]|uniref:Uncharacterized protein n=1 Tax=Pluteus cervinus TaxID=181527 RepID=A0ACD3ADQ6_9AGAR|nr:hypothetical protein BDN72DRAFT_847188 [Pluteus cervinus]
MEDPSLTTFLPSPKLPPELEQPIFEIAAFSDPKTAVCLLRVSRALHEWIGSFTYRTIAHHLPIPRGTSGKRYPDLAWYQRYGKFVRHLLLSLSVTDEIAPFLACCPHIEDLAIWGPESPPDMDKILGVLTELKTRPIIHLTELSTTIESLFAVAHRQSTHEHGTVPSDDDPPRSAFPFQFSIALGQHPILKHITHLELLDPCQAWEIYTGLASIPNLTHLCVSSWADRRFILGALKNCHHLEALVLMKLLTLAEMEDGEGCRLVDQDNIQGEFQLFEGQSELGIERIVEVGVVYPHYWVNAAKGSKSMWMFADEVIEERRGRK